MGKKYSFDKDRIKVLLLEGIHKSATEFFNSRGYHNIESYPNAFDDDLLKEKISTANIIGIRSRTNITKDVLKEAGKLLAIGCFSIGTNQVDGHTARLMGIPIFNAPFSNTRSVAELVIAETILLMRNIPIKNAQLTGESGSSRRPIVLRSGARIWVSWVTDILVLRSRFLQRRWV